MAAIKLPALPGIPEGTDPALAAILTSMKERLEILSGERGAKLTDAERLQPSLGIAPVNRAGDRMSGELTAPRIHLPNQPAFHATKTTGGGAPAGFNGVISWDTVLVNRGGCYNAANGRFTAPVAGSYFFSMHGFCVQSEASGIMLAANTGWGRFYKNGVAVTGPATHGHWSGSNSYASMSFSAVFNLAVDDYIQYVHEGAFLYGDSGQSHNGFCGFLLG